MYFDEDNFFPSMEESGDDLKKMMGLSISNQQDILESYQNHNHNHDNGSQDEKYVGRIQQQENSDQISKQRDYQQYEQSSSTQNQASRLIHEAYSKYQTQIKSLLPQVCIYYIHPTQIHSHLIQKHHNQYEINHQKRLNTFKQQLQTNYQQQIETKIDQIKQNINSNLTHKINTINSLKEQINISKKNKPQKLTPQQESQLVEKTIKEIFNSQKLLTQIKQKLQPKVEDRVKFILLRDLQKELNKCQNQIEDKIAQQREEFKQKRKIYWQQQAQNQLTQLAVEYSQLKQKKASMDQIVKQRLSEKQQTIKKHKQAIERCKQVKQLQKQIKSIQQKIIQSRNKNNKKRSLSKGLDAKNNKKTIR